MHIYKRHSVNKGNLLKRNFFFLFFFFSKHVKSVLFGIFVLMLFKMLANQCAPDLNRIIKSLVFDKCRSRKIYRMCDV